MKEIHIAPLEIDGPFHLGRVTEVVTGDLYTRWLISLSRYQTLSFVHDSWNIFAGKGYQPEGLQKQKEAKSRLSLLPSGDVDLSGGEIAFGQYQEFRDDNPVNEELVNQAIQILRRKGFIVPGTIDGERGLYLDIEKITQGTGASEILKNTIVFPRSMKNLLLRSLDPTNPSAYLSKIPITRKKLFGIQVKPNLLEPEGVEPYFDPRFSPSRSQAGKMVPEGNVCVSPLTVLALLPYLRRGMDQSREICFITNGKASAIRFNLVSLLLCCALEAGPIEATHLFAKIHLPRYEGLETGTFLGPEHSSKLRYLVFDQISEHDKRIDEHISEFGVLHDDVNVPGYNSLKRKLKTMLGYLALERRDNQLHFSRQEVDYLRAKGVYPAMEDLNFSKSFKILRGEVSRRSREIQTGVSPFDITLIRGINLFLPDILTTLYR